ncbi:MAG: 1-deoxy-D-xylulose-5-phosphate reductoisomerase [Kordiimonadaceae bacterium]|nr:1-deoxy-D-xylulose-5-phosphate reductoisomerase [Kordiimonadaceae bacterium]MBO6570329.1 1-deoxy-D-xylulose-5-phosphate reductoisomerase [Kordiimonadaceae bacterium]MBO6965573.1 1-deoxy-D-xylulose-5-phosphate reductoisomerase [Kordiimonadaceae bacterium]
MSTIKSISILGATGSVGASTVDLVRRNPDRFAIKALTANSNVNALAALAREFSAEVAVIADETLYSDLKEALAGTAVTALCGTEGLIAAAEVSCDLVMAAIVGAAGLRPTLAAVRQGKTIALANKECLVCAGELFMQEAEKSGARILPVDSEHNAIYQVFDFERATTVEKIILTASGGPFWQKRTDCLKNVTPAEAVAHPNWDMGQKISVDSATMMNKGLEVIEAFHLFPVQKDQIEVVIHPQSVIHSMVQYNDGSVLAQLGSPDMRTPIAYALAWPDRIDAPVPSLSLPELAQLTFAEPDLEKFECLKLAMDALHEGGSAPLALNAANEVAVEAFLKEKIGFMDISSVVKATLDKIDMKAPHSLSNVFEQDQEARLIAQNLLTQLAA